METAAGLRPIEDIEVGDYVWSEDVETGEQTLQKVLQAFVSQTNTLVHVELSSGEVINTTEGHPFFTEEKGWCVASELEVGDALRTQSGEYVTVVSVTVDKLDEPVKVYNLEVEDGHTYYVADEGVLVHNMCQVVDNKKEPQGVGNPVEVAGKGTTGRTEPNSLKEQMAMHQVKSNPLEGAIDLSAISKPIVMSDDRWEAIDGWVKMSNNVDGIEIHFVYNKVLDIFDDFKFK